MGLLEILFKRSNPRAIGEVTINKQKPEEPQVRVLSIKLIISIVIIGFMFYVTVLRNLNSGSVIGFIIVLTVYCLYGYVIMPKPDYSNMGWAGGRFDNPFRRSDNINRFLRGLKIALYPGRFIATTFVQVFLLIKGEYK